MEEQLVSFETAKLAKKKGFNVPCCMGYHVPSKTIVMAFSSITNTDDVHYSAPKQSLLQYWLRDIFNIFIQPKQLHTGDTEFKIVNGIGEPLAEPEVFMYYDGKLGGLELALQKALNIIK